MIRRSALAFLGFLAVSTAFADPSRRVPIFAPSDMNEIIPGQVLVKFSQDHARAIATNPMYRMAAGKGKLRQAQFVRQLGSTGWTLWFVPESTDTKALAKSLMSTEGVAYAQPVNRVYPLLTPPNDPDVGVLEEDEGVMFGTPPTYFRLWHLQDTFLLDQNTKTDGAFAMYPNRWYSANTTNKIARRISFIDTGADLLHPDFMNAGADSTYYRDGGQLDLQRSHFWRFGAIDPSDSAMDAHGHGTHVMGLAMAAGNNGSFAGHGTIGSGYGAVGLMQRVFDDQGVGTDTDAAYAIIYSADQGCDVINISLGTENYSQVFQDAITYATQKGCLVVCAANEDGSGGGDLGPMYPAACSGSLAVTANGPDYFPATTYAGNGYYIDVAAPGGDIVFDLSDPENPVFYIQFVWSTAARYPVTASNIPNLIPPYSENYAYLAGTSMACPIVAGAAALYMEAKRIGFTSPWSNIRTYQAIQRSAIGAGAPNGGWEMNQGFGSLDGEALLMDINARNAAIGGLEGIVYINGVATANIQVRAQRTTPGHPIFSTTTKPDGTYRFDGMPEGEFNVWTVGGATSKQKRARIRNGCDQSGVNFHLGSILFDSTGPEGWIALRSPGMSPSQLEVRNFAYDTETSIDRMTFRLGSSEGADNIISEKEFLVGDAARTFTGLNLSPSGRYHVTYRMWNGEGLMKEVKFRYVMRP